MTDNAAVLALATPLVKSHEGCRLMAYKDTRGIWTIAWGRADSEVRQNMTCTQRQADDWLAAKLETILGELDDHLSWWRNMSLPRQAVLIDMAYNLGVTGLLGFQGAIQAMSVRAYADAAQRMLESHWASQVPSRAKADAAIMRSGVMK